MLDGHFDFGNGYHGRVYLNPHQLFRQPSTIWRFAQDLLDVLPADDRWRRPKWWPVRRPAARCWRTRWRGCSTAAARSRGRRRSSRRSVPEGWRRPHAQPFYREQIAGPPRAARGRRAQHRPDARALRRRWCARPAERWSPPREIYDRMEAVVDAGVPNVALAEYKAPENHPGQLMPAVPGRRARHRVLTGPPRGELLRRSSIRSIARSITSIPRLDPVHIVRRYASREDREIVGFCAAALAFGRVASVLQSVEALLAVMGPRPGRVRPRASTPASDARRDRAARAPLDSRARPRGAAADPAAHAARARIDRGRSSSRATIRRRLTCGRRSTRSRRARSKPT